MTREERDDADARELASLGYAQRLLRDMGGFSNFAVSFSIISILTGAVQLFGYGLKHGGPFEMTAGWPLATALTLTVACALAELASAYPTAGALYHWSSILGGRSWGWFTAWTNSIGQFAVTAGVDYGLSEFLVDLLGVPGGRPATLAIFAALLVSHATLNHVGIGIVAVLNDLSAIYHVLGALAIIAVSLLLPRAHHWPVLLDRTTAYPRPYAYGFLVGLLQAMWTFTGYDASAHVSEETHDPRRNAPWGLVLSVAVSGVVGYVMLLTLTVLVGDVAKAQAAANPFLYTLCDALGARAGSALTWLCVLAMWFCGLASVTSNSRMLFAFARDGGLPGGAFFAHVSPRFRTPDRAVWASALAALAIALSSAAYSVMTSIAVLALYVSYGLPILAALRARRRGALAPAGPWHLGRASPAVQTVAVSWVLILLVVLVLPPNEMAGYTGAALGALLVLVWFAGPRRTFRGPPIRFDSCRPDACVVER